MTKNFTPDKEQEEAIYSGGGQILVVAGAGSGKTFTLTQKIRVLLESGVFPYNILAFTFTRKAAKEMKDRVNCLSSGSSKGITIGTIHSVLYGFYLRHMVPGSDKPTLLIDRKEMVFISKLLSDLGLPEYNFSTAKSMMSIMKNYGYTVDEFFRRLNTDQQDYFQWFYDFVVQYERRRKKNNLMSFDDMLYDVYTMMKNGHPIAKAMQSRFHYVLVDEFQDVNRVQFEVIKIIQELHGNLFAVGDPRQAIFGFRNTTPEMLIEFQEIFPMSRVVYLKNNYRSSVKIVELGNQLIRNGKWKFPDTQSMRDGGEVINLGHFRDPDDEAESVISGIIERNEEGIKWGDMAVIYRTNSQSRAIEESCIQRGIPYYVDNGFYARAEVADLVAYAKVIVEDDYDSLFRIINRPNRFLGMRMQSELRMYINSGQLPEIWDHLRLGFSKPYMTKKAFELWQNIQRWKMLLSQGVPLSTILSNVIDTVKYKEYLKSKFEDPSDRLDNVRELIETSKNFKSAKSWLRYVDMMKEKMGEAMANSDRVQLLTIHKAKGLEWDTTFLIGISEGIIPHHKSDNVDEERRMFYVALTRASEKAYISSVLSFGHQSEVVLLPSRFLKDIDLYTGGESMERVKVASV